jgi:hypothetical protein
MKLSRECQGCRHHFWTNRLTWCKKYDRRYIGSSIVAREHDPGRCWEAKDEEPRSVSPDGEQQR